MKQPLIDNIQHTKNFKTKTNKIKTAELRIIMFLIQYNLAISLISPIIDLIKAVASDSEIAKSLKCGKTKATETINTILNEEGLEEIGKIIRNQPFSLIIDETTDVSTTKCLVLVVRYFDFVVCKVRDKFLSLISIENCDSLNIYKTIVTFFQNIQVPHKNIVGFASDNASVMMGKKSGVKTLLQKDQPHLYVMGCICHSLHLCSSAASKKLPSHLEALTRNIYSFFAHSPKRKLELEEFQKYFSVEVHKILKMSSTRWLSLENVISRILEQWVPLQHFFISYELESNMDLAHNICSEITEINKTYLSFLGYVLNITNKINIEFQAEAPKIHTLLQTVKMYYKTLLQNFVKPPFIDDLQLHKIDFSNENIFLKLNDIYIGAKAAIIINKKNISDSDVRAIKINCRDYYIELCKQVRSRINFDDEVLIAIQGIDPKNLAPSLVPLMMLFPNLVDETDSENLDEEWRLFLNQTCVSNELDFEDFYRCVFQSKNALNEYLFPLIRKFVGTIIAFPHSSATAERKFSEVSLIKDKKRNCLHVETVNSILTAKELLNNNSCEKWVPSKSLIEKYKKRGLE